MSQRPSPGGWRTAGLTTRAPAAKARRPRPFPQLAIASPIAPTHSLPNTAPHSLPFSGLPLFPQTFRVLTGPRTLLASTVPRPPRSPRFSPAQDLPRSLVHRVFSSARVSRAFPGFRLSPELSIPNIPPPAIFGHTDVPPILRRQVLQSRSRL